MLEKTEDSLEPELVLPTPEEDKGPSPFLPGTKIQYSWDSTSLGWLKGCPRLYYYSMILGYRGKDESVHLRFGLEYHRALQDYDIYKTADLTHAEAMHLVVKELLERTFEWKSDNDYKNRDNLVRTVIWYLDKWKDDPAKTVVLDGGQAAVELSFRFELDWGPRVTYNSTGEGSPQPYILCGHLDRVVSFQDELYVMDRKTTKSQPSPWYYSQYEPDNQMSLYSLGGQVVLGAPVRGVIIDVAQVLQDTSVFGRGFTYRTKDQTEEWLKDLKILLRQAEEYATEDYWPMNDKFCGTYRSEESGSVGCPFRDICSKSPHVRERFLESNYRKEPWNPLIPR